MENKDKKYLSTTEVAKIFGISHVAVFKKIQSGEIQAEKIGRNYIIAKNTLNKALGTELTAEKKKKIEASVEKTLNEYSEALRLLGKE